MRIEAVAEMESKMICPRCRVEMNHHCDKLVYAVDPQNAGVDTSTVGGLIEEFHTCPKCGGTVPRHASKVHE
jgi:ribosomal protein S27AE